MTAEDDKHVIHGHEPFEPLPESDYTAGMLIFESLLKSYGTDDAMVDALTGKSITYKTLLEETCNLAEALRSYGYSTNAVFSICSENSLQFFIPVLASLYIGSILAPINHIYTPTELKHTLNISRPKVMFCSEKVASKLVNLKKEVDYMDKIIIIDSDKAVTGTETLKEFVTTGMRGTRITPYKFQPLQAESAKLGAFILCSSGTTGLPKGVLLSQLNILTRLVQSRDPLNAYYGVELGLMPFFHSYGLNTCLNSIALKKKIIVFGKFQEDAFLKSIQDYKISVLLLAPPLAVFLEKSPKVLKYDLSSVQEIICGAAPLSKNTEIALKKRLKNISSIRQGYGLTEATLAVTVVERTVLRPGSCGKVTSFMSCKVRDPETGKSLGPKQVGEICVKGPLVMMGYYNNEKATRETFTSDGWLRTGDLGYYDDEGYFYIVDRLKELIKYKGYQVAPAELEALLLTHPKVRDVGVVGLPDEAAGELPLAFVVKHEGVSVTEAELQQYVANLVSPQKRLRGGVIFVTEIPKNPSGKILRRELKQKLNNYKGLKESKL